MKTSLFSVVTLVAASVFSVAVLIAGGQAGGGGQRRAGGAGGQGARAQAAGPAIPRTEDGKPDLSGIWQVLDNSLDANIEPHSASYGARAGQGAIVDPPDGKIPYLPAALAK